jgi:hypothetical protein
VSDFTVTPKHSLFTRTFWPLVLGLDGVHPRAEHIAHLDATFQRVHCLVEKGGFPYIPELLLLGGALLGAGAALALGAYGLPTGASCTLSAALGLAGQGQLGALGQCASGAVAAALGASASGALPATYGLAVGAWALGAAALLNAAATAFFAFCVVSYLFLDGEELLGPSAVSGALVAGFYALWYGGGIAWSAGVPAAPAGSSGQWYEAVTRGHALPGVYAYGAALVDGSVGGYSLAQQVQVPVIAWFAVVGGLLGYALSAFLKAPYYSYVAQKRRA